jgi:hypothetical protein
VDSTERFQPSLTLRAEVADADDEIARLQERETELEQALAADRITNKEDFFARLDVISREGRTRANVLLKRLEIVVTAFKGPDGSITYQVHQKGEPIFTMVDGKELITIPLNDDQRQKFKEQDADGSELARGMEWLNSKIGPMGKQTKEPEAA